MSVTTADRTHGAASTASAERVEHDLSALTALLAPLPPRERLAAIRARITGRIVLTTSFGPEDQLLTHWIAHGALNIDLVTLDTGRLFEETHALWAETEGRYARRIAGLFPDADRLAELMADQGTNGFYHAIEARKACCGVRKVEPLGRALSGAAVWITGLRGDQSANRAATPLIERDAAHDFIKLNPLFDWTHEDVHQACAAEQVPLNPLHARGFASIGCAPCTRAIAPGEDERAGRWWWEQQGARECGLHSDDTGRLVRAGGDV